MMILMMLTQTYHSDTSSVVTDEDILDVAEDKGDALKSLYEKTHKSIYGFALSITKNPHDAEDTLQEVFVAVMKSSVNYAPKGKPMAWLLTITKNIATSKLRQRKNDLSLDEALNENEDAFLRIDSIEDRMLLKSLLQALSDEEREILMLHAVSGLKNREIAKVMSLPLNTVLSKYNRALKKLRLIVEGEK